jgi:hypothetical protein
VRAARTTAAGAGRSAGESPGEGAEPGAEQRCEQQSGQRRLTRLADAEFHPVLVPQARRDHHAVWIAGFAPTPRRWRRALERHVVREQRDRDRGEHRQQQGAAGSSPAERPSSPASTRMNRSITPPPASPCACPPGPLRPPGRLLLLPARLDQPTLSQPDQDRVQAARLQPRVFRDPIPMPPPHRFRAQCRKVRGRTSVSVVRSSRCQCTGQVGFEEDTRSRWR